MYAAPVGAADGPPTLVVEPPAVVPAELAVVEDDPPAAVELGAAVETAADVGGVVELDLVSLPQATSSVKAAAATAIRTLVV